LQQFSEIGASMLITLPLSGKLQPFENDEQEIFMNRKIVKLTQVLIFIFAVSFAQVFAQGDVPRKTVAVTYPLGTPVDVSFRGTTRFPRLRGTARAERKNRTGTKVTISLENLPRPYELGAAYTTYVLWAITPEGQVDRLGELKYRSGTVFQNPKGEFTTPLQTFALIVTAEPHYLVKQPSQAVILENVAPAANTASIVNVQYFGNSSDYFRDPRVAEIADTDYVRTPVSLLGARQAINLARYAGAERDAQVEFEYATKSLEQAENSWRSNQDDEQIDVLARQAIAAGVRAEETAVVRKEAREKRNEAARRDAEVRKAEDRTSQIEEEMRDLRAELDRERRARELAERDSGNVTKQVSDLRQENQRLRDELARARSESEDAKLRVARMEGEKQVLEAQRQAQERLERVNAAAPVLRQTLKQYGAVRDNGRGIQLTLAENLWASPRETGFAPTANAKLEQLAALLANNPDYRLLIEAHTDDKGTPEELVALTEQRASAMANKFESLGINRSRLEIKGLGASYPLVPNTTVANRAKNRRVEITLIVIENAPTTENQATQ
jgi:outer membrane protein OmpA-like peptidoglycan-associated protein